MPCRTLLYVILTVFSSLLAACGSAERAPVPVSARAASEPLAQEVPAITTVGTPTTASVTHQVVFSNVRSVPRCFYFSGPDVPEADIRDRFPVAASLERDGELNVLRFSSSAVFRGAEGQPLERVTTYEYQGKWSITERIVMTSATTGSYSYEECHLDAVGCPGNCTLTADLTLQ